ncbi:MAG: hypothetical protein IIC23_05160 [Chloroflexi bacterium]|nr:hypothetical protein [Chloroflexota bacterium]
MIAGANGFIGGAVLQRLGDKYDFGALTRRPVDGTPCMQADIRDIAAIQPANHDTHAGRHLSG